MNTPLSNTSNNPANQSAPPMRHKVTDIFSREEIRLLTERSDLMGIWAIVSTWAAIAACFAALAWAIQQPIAISVPIALLAIALLGGRQLALAIITHEAAHKTLFKTKWANGWLADWLCARAIALDTEKYRQHHLIHHKYTGGDKDSDISLIEGLPTTRASLARKFLRDLSGITGIKFLLGRVLMDAERIKWTVATDIQALPNKGPRYHLLAFIKNALPAFVCNAVLFAILAASGYPQLYLAWIIAYLIPYPLFIRIRALAEHAGTERSSDMFKNTRSTEAGLLARIFVAPFFVNYHIEHHAMMSVPWFRLKRMHQMLRQKQLVQQPPSYAQVLNLVSSA